MGNETEIKIRLTQPFVTIARCKELWGPPREAFQRDEYYDSISGGLRSQDITLRLRSINGEIFLALKSPRVYVTELIQTRIELQFKVAEEVSVRSPIAAQGLNANTVIEKQRLSFRDGSLAVEIDRLPYIGYFLEIEGRTVAEIELALAEIGLSQDDAVRENYTELLERKFAELGKPADKLEATFENEARA